MPNALGEGTFKSLFNDLSSVSRRWLAMASLCSSLATPIALAHWAKRDGAPGSENSVTSGSSIALLKPCGT